MDYIESVVQERQDAEERVIELEKAKRQIGAQAAHIEAALSISQAEAAGQGIGQSGVSERKESDSKEAELDAHVEAVEGQGPVGEDAIRWAVDARVKVVGDGQGEASAQVPPIDKLLGGARRASADGRLQASAVTKAQSFSFHSPQTAGKESISKRRAEEDRKRREAEAEAALHYKFTAKPIPQSTRIPLFGMIMSRMETRRKLKHEARFNEMKEIIKPFTLLMEHEAELKARVASNRARTEIALAKELNEARRFHALPIPDTIQNPDSEYRAQIAREQERPERVAAAARALAASASLPPRMAIAEEADKRRKLEREAKLKAEELQEKRATRFRANGMPDFDELHHQFSEAMRETRQSFAATTLIPFGFDSEERKAAEAARKEALKREHELATSASLELRARSRSAQGPRSTELSQTSRSAFPVGATGSITPGRRHSTAERPAPHAQPPPAAMTRTVRLRMLEVQKRVRERQEREQQLALEEEARKAKIREATRQVAPMVQQLEAERNPIPLAWQEGATATAASLAKQRFEESARKNAEEQRRRVEAAAEARPMLFMRTSMDVRREEARRSAMMEAAKTVGAPAAKGWAEVVASGLEGAELFDEEDRQFLSSGRRRPQSAAV